MTKTVKPGCPLQAAQSGRVQPWLAKKNVVRGLVGDEGGSDEELGFFLKIKVNLNRLCNRIFHNQLSSYN